MDNWKIRQTIDLARSGQTLRVWPDALMVEGDNEAHTWEITVMENGKPANLDGVTCLVHFLRVREGQDEDVVCKGSIAGNVASVELKAECYVEGQAIGLFRIVVNGRTLTLSKLLFTISKGPTGVVIDPASAVGSLDDLIAKIDAIEAATADGRAQQEQVVQAELSRVSAEQSRVTAEQSRVTAEQERASSESSRASAEQARDTAEQSRAAAEQGRITAEISRASAEQSRVNAEQSRVNAEQERVTAESSRVSAETERMAAETARTEAEAQRAQTFARFEGEIGSLKDDLSYLDNAITSGTYQFATKWNLGFPVDGDKATGGDGTNGITTNALRLQKDATINYNTDRIKQVRVFEVDSEYNLGSFIVYTNGQTIPKTDNLYRMTAVPQSGIELAISFM